MTTPALLPRLLAALLAAAPAAALGADSPAPAPAPTRPGDADLAAARRAVEAQDWAVALERLEKARAAQPGNADVHNLLGFAERKRGNLDAAFAHYAEALRLDPRHRGAHEYAGEAWLLKGDLGKAKEHLAALDKLCTFSCEEYRDLKKAVAAYEKRQATPAR